MVLWERVGNRWICPEFLDFPDSHNPFFVGLSVTDYGRGGYYIVSKPKHKTHKALKIVPAMDLEDLTARAFSGAKYHLNKIRENLHSPTIQTYLAWKSGEGLDLATQKQLEHFDNEFGWHLRAFFWEMVATFETMQNCAKQRSKKANKDQAEWYKKSALLESAWQSEWYFEIEQYRNFAHQAFLFVQCDYSEHKEANAVKYKLNITSLLPAREGQQQCMDILEHLSSYWEKMRDLGANIFRK
jgi:hypothetical protein